MTYEVRRDFNRYLGNWVELVPAGHPWGCRCKDCQPPPSKQYRERDSLDDKQSRTFWK